MYGSACRQHATEALRSMKFSDLDGKAIFFPENVRQRPYQRVVIAQAADAISTQYDIEKLRPDLEPFCLDVLSDFPKKREVLAWVKTSMVNVPHWPVGPDAANNSVDIEEAAPHDEPSEPDTLDCACTDSD